MKHDIQYNPDYKANRWVGYFDLLGVEQLAKNKGYISVFVTLSKAIKEFRASGKSFDKVGFAWFSDSFLVYTSDDSVESFVAIDSISRWFFYFLLTGEIPIRGAISCDLLYADKENNLFFGKALIEAYKYGEAQDWIGFFLCPSAVDRLELLGLPPKKWKNYAYADIPFNKRTNTLIKKLPACIMGKWVSTNGRNRCLDSLRKMKDQVVDKKFIRKYDHTIAFIKKNKQKGSGPDR